MRAARRGCARARRCGRAERSIPAVLWLSLGTPLHRQEQAYHCTWHPDMSACSMVGHAIGRQSERELYLLLLIATNSTRS
jgi:hypothetical protein